MQMMQSLTKGEKAKRLLYNTLLLTAAAMFMRAVGLSFQVYLAEQIGPAGIGLFQLIASTQLLAMTIALSGIRFATTRLVSEELGRGNHAAVRHVMRRCFTHALCFGALAASLLFFGANWIGTVWIGDARAVLSLRILALSLPAVACLAVMGGYFTAVSRVVKAASVQVIEHLIRVFIIVGLLTIRAPRDLEEACALIVIGGVTAELISCSLLFIIYLRDRARLPHKRDDGDAQYTRRLLRISVPLAFSAYARSGLNTLQQMLIPRGLRRSGADSEQALASFGVVQGMALPLILFPSALFSAIGELIVPELTAAQVAGDREKISQLVSKLLRNALCISIGLFGLFWAFSYALGAVVYPLNPEVGPFIRILSPLMPIIFLDTITDGMLKGLGQQVYSMGVNIVDSLLSVILVYVLLPIFAVSGFIWMLYFTELFNFFFSLLRISKITKIRVSLGDILKPTLAAFAAVQISTAILRTFGLPLAGSALSVIAHFALGGGIYVVFLLVLTRIGSHRHILRGLSMKP